MKTVVDTQKGPIECPCFEVKLVNINNVQANDYNPNHVSKPNMELLEESIICNGFCFPVVTIFDRESGKYIIIDGFHRYLIFRDYLKAELLPVVVLGHDMSKRLAATVQFNRARGVHQVDAMGELVARLAGEGLDELKISNVLGMSIEEVVRLSRTTGIAELFKDERYSQAWEIIEK